MDTRDELNFLSERERDGWAKVKVHTVGELLRFFPKRYEDRRSFDAFPAQAGGDPLCLRAVSYTHLTLPTIYSV